MTFADFDTQEISPSPAASGLAPGAEAVLMASSENLGFVHAFIASLAMIVVSELGDKTFFIAAIMAMNHPRITVFSGAMTALAFMTVLSALFGFATTVIPRVYTYYISAALFVFFGCKMIYDGLKMSHDEGKEELEEVQTSLRRKDDDDVESQHNTDVKVDPTTTSSKFQLPSAARRILFALFSRIFLQALTMTFLAEWGDRSQIATVVLAATEDVPGVCVGGVLGHSLCTGLAVMGGRIVAQKISVRTVTIVGGVVFLLFAITSLLISPS